MNGEQGRANGRSGNDRGGGGGGAEEDFFVGANAEIRAAEFIVYNDIVDPRTARAYRLGKNILGAKGNGNSRGEAAGGRWILFQSGSVWYLCVAATRDASKGCSITGVCVCFGDPTAAAQHGRTRFLLKQGSFQVTY